MRTVRKYRRDGFTLVELVIVVTLMGLLAATVSAAIVVFIRNDDSVTSRLTDTRDLQNLANYFPGDVASANEIRFRDPGDPLATGTTLFLTSPCIGLANDPQLQLFWSQTWRDGVTSEFEVVYDLDGSGDLVRLACDTSGNRSLVLAKRFSSFSMQDPSNGTIYFDLTFADGSARRISASSRNYNP